MFVQFLVVKYGIIDAPVMKVNSLIRSNFIFRQKLEFLKGFLVGGEGAFLAKTTVFVNIHNNLLKKITIAVWGN